MTTTSNAGQSVWTTPSDREIVATRVFDAPRRLVFAAFTEPEHVQHWLLGPDGWTMPVCEIDLRVGGEWRYVYRNPGDGREFEMHGIYREIVRPERVVNTERFGDGESLNTLELAEHDGLTTVVQTMLLASKDHRDGALATGMARGVDISYDRLDNYLQSLAG